MANPASLVLELAKGLMSRIKDVKRNHDECQFLKSLAEQTLNILQFLEGRVFDSLTTSALKLVIDALMNAKEEVDKCCSTAVMNALLYNDNNALALKHAAEKLEHALSHIPLATLGMTADIQSDVVTLATQMRNARLEDRARGAHHAMNVREAVERSSHQTSEEHSEIKNLVHLLLKQNAFGFEEIKKEINLLRRDSDCLKREQNEIKKEEQKKGQFELKTIIEALCESLTEATKAKSAMLGLKNYLHCPISNEIMTDPVLLKESNIIYDRSSIEDWIGQGHGYDPQTNTRLVSRDLVSIPNLCTFCQIMLDQSGDDHSSIAYSYQDQSKQQLEPGLYEGRGRLFVGSTIVPISQLLSLEPNGKVVGCTLYMDKNFGDKETTIAIGEGEWDDTSRELFLRDTHYNYHGGIENSDDDTQIRIKWNRNLSAKNNSYERCNSTLTCSPPYTPLIDQLHPAIMQTEGNTNMARSQVTYKSKLVLSLEADWTVGGWTSFESSTKESTFIGHISKGRWDEDGFLKFAVHFTPKNGPSNYIDAFKVAGIVNCDGTHHPTFSSIFRKVTDEGELMNANKIQTPSNGAIHLDYPLLHEVSTRWHDLHPRPLRLFQISRNVAFECSQDESNMQIDTKYHYELCSQHTIGGSPLHLASQNNHVNAVKELITKGANIQCQDKNGLTPLHLAAQNNHVNVVKELITKGAYINAQDNRGQMPLYVATQYNHMAIVKDLIVCGASIDLSDNNGWTSLHIASQNNCLNIVQALIARGANVNFQDVDGVSPLHLASQNNHLDVVKELVSNGANVDLQDSNGASALHIASRCGIVPIVQILLEHGASTDIGNNQRKTPYDVMCTYPYCGPFDQVTIKQLQVLLKE